MAVERRGSVIAVFIAVSSALAFTVIKGSVWRGTPIVLEGSNCSDAIWIIISFSVDIGRTVRIWMVGMDSESIFNAPHGIYVVGGSMWVWVIATAKAWLTYSARFLSAFSIIRASRFW